MSANGKEHWAHDIHPLTYSGGACGVAEAEELVREGKGRDDLLSISYGAKLSLKFSVSFAWLISLKRNSKLSILIYDHK